ncbi:hypothetical protein, partial [Rhizobium brockwellii]|uniref:hypothetical protein n=1 Tax=Rhizobium brockwellii TaxID=3019932 RepID=UPI003F99E792
IIKIILQPTRIKVNRSKIHINHTEQKSQLNGNTLKSVCNNYDFDLIIQIRVITKQIDLQPHKKTIADL